MSILIVDRKENETWILARQLSGEGYEVKIASDVKEAIFALRQRPFDLVITETHILTEVDGFEVLEFIQNSGELKSPKIKAIVLTGFADLDNCIKSKKRGAADFLSKPYDLYDLLKTIERVLGEKVPVF